MITLRKSGTRGHFNHGWLDTYHTFSFGDYHDPAFMGFRKLRVINEDRVQPGQGFPPHSHRDMEIITYVLEGALEHKDSMGNTSAIVPGEVQRMSAGTGVTHSEYNHSQKEPVHLLQIWIETQTRGLPPSYEQKTFPESRKKNRLCLIASSEGSEESVKVHQDVRIYASRLDSGKEIHFSLPGKRYGWVQAAKGKLRLNGTLLAAGDGAAIQNETELDFKADAASEFLIFDLA